MGERRLRVVAVTSIALVLASAGTATGGDRPFGTAPIPISTAPGGRPANGPSGGAAVSGDNRKTRIAAFHSDASNLVPGDTNGVTDVFVWFRPRGRQGLRLNRPMGKVVRVSVTDRGDQANGPSANPSLDGSLKSTPHCVAFQSEASNLVGGDTDTEADVYVRDLRARHTFLVSRDVAGPATNPSIDGACRRVAFTAAGTVYVAPARGGRPRALGAGSQPSFSRDGSAITWVRADGAVMLNRAGSTNVVAPHGSNPHVSDNEFGEWGVVFDTADRLSGKDRNSSTDVYTRTMRARGGPAKTDLISAPRRGARAFGNSSNGGITSYGQHHGIITFVVHARGGDTLNYRNNRTGNIDDLAHSRGGFADVATSARANFMAFTSRSSLSRFGRNPFPNVYFKTLVDGEPI
jgi:hypothetical protein